MADLAGACLRAGLGFVEARLAAVEQNALQAAADLAGQLGPPAAGADLPAADVELTQARNELAAFHAALAQPVGFAPAADAAGHLAAGLHHVDRAVELARPGSRLSDLLNAPFSAPLVPTGIAQQLGLQTAAGPALVGGTLSYEVTSAGPVTVFGGPPRLQAASTRLRATLRLDGSHPALAVSVALNGASVAVGGPAFDGFVNTLLGGGGTTVEADLVLGVDSDRGVTVGGSTHGPVVLPARASTGVVDVRGLDLDRPDGDPNAIDLGALVAASLGDAVRFAVEGIGVRAHVDPDRVSGAGGPPISVEAKPPRGVSASLSGSLVKGGGYLAHDPDQGSYAGALDVRVGVVEAKAFGILDTRVPGGFSLIVVISAEFNPPIELALAFTLNGVGGIVGIQRVLDTDALRSRLHDHAVDHLLFPADPVSAAPEILRTLGAVFPPHAGSVVLGPMLKVGWGRPVSFVTASLGVVVSVPDPKVILLGNVRLAVPSPELPIVDLKADVYGEFSAERVLVLVMLEDSRVGGYPVSGDIGFFVGFGSEAAFAISGGGFHPRYHPPKELADMRRLSMDLSPPAVLNVRATAYVALTTGSFQLGGGLEISGEAGPVSVHGHLQLDAIVHWEPAFGFEADLGAGFDMRWEGQTFAGVELRLHLQGPTPWMAHGTATIDVPIFPDVPVEVGPITWGDSHNPPPPQAHPLDLVRTALSKPSAWRATLPAGADGLVTLRTDPADPPLLVHPLGQFEGRQTAVPLETVIARVGASRVPSDENRIHLGQPAVKDEAGEPIEAGAVSPVVDRFAAGQFLDLSDDEKLRRPSFEEMLAGIRLGPVDGVRTDEARVQQSELHYNTVFPHQDVGIARHAFFDLKESAFTVLGAGAAGRSALRSDVRYAAVSRPITLSDPAAVRIRGVSDLGEAEGVPTEAMTYSHAAEALAAAVGAEPGRAASLQLVALGSEL